MSSFIEISRRGAILAEAKARGGFGPLAREPEAIVRTGQDGLSALSSAADVAAASRAITAAPQSAEDAMQALRDGVACLRGDVALDACSESYGDECKGNDSEVDQVADCLKKIELGKAGELTPVTWQDALTCAGVEASEENKKKFADCVRVKETAWHTVPRGTLGYCAMAVRRGIAGSAKAHSTQVWRDKLETWAREFDVFDQKWRSASAGEVGVWASATGPSMSDVQPYVARYNKLRDEFISAGGQTSCGAIETPGSSVIKWVAIGAVVIVVGFFLFKFVGATAERAATRVAGGA